MSFKKTLLSILFFIPFLSFAQVEKPAKTSEILVKEFRIEAKNMDELKNFNWEMIPEMFKTNYKTDSITLSVSYANKDNVSKSSSKVIKFNYKISGKTEDISKLISASKSAVNNFTSAVKD
ncbi:hypothetical protein A5893_07580 [Pedobacter psychrophilus]|uniref:Uncharacterized protein n=1 Tax=Pedobacter psychrophilus TaxID=1826909 RepID=A0A179DIL9_9SPHI|nr:hypothetical protein [Pedobacter psychrophilus]OAQ40788.1 hypothetical protein A5893_07580 [Pedobacter psychrophilus]